LVVTKGEAMTKFAGLFEPKSWRYRKLHWGRSAILRRALFFVTLLATALIEPTHSATTNPSEDSNRDSKDMRVASKPLLLREGSEVVRALAKCRASGDKLVLEFRETGRMMAALENLAAQRVLKAVVEDPSNVEWIVSGSVTEFNGRNYLYLKQAKRGIVDRKRSSTQ